MRLVLWCDGSAIVISAVPTMMHCVSERGLRCYCVSKILQPLARQGARSREGLWTE